MLNYISAIIVFLSCIIIYSSYDFTFSNKNLNNNSALSNCTLSISLDNKNIEDRLCFCPSETIDKHVTEALQILNVITASPYFRYFKTNSYKPCPYWGVNLLCSSSENACSICKCDENSVPTVFHTSYDMSDIKTPTSFITQTVPHPSNADSWGSWFNPGIENDENDENEYVDLIQNPEGNTGFSGPQAANVWNAIYNENCLPLEKQESCKALTFPRTLFSGLHTSILIHVATNFHKDLRYESPHIAAGIYNNPNISYFPNCELFLSRIAPGTKYLENLYVLYEFVFRSIALSKDAFLANMSIYNSGEGGIEVDEDAQLKQSLFDLFNSQSVSAKTFDEDKFSEGVSSSQLKQIHSMMSNVTSLMDCVACQKCRIWGKLETKGVATAMNIICKKGNIPLDRSERVTLLNLARQVAFSVRSVQYLNKICNEGEFLGFH